MDADTIDSTSRTPDPSLEFYLSQAAGLMGSPKALGTEGIKTEPVGSGPYVMDKAATVKDSQSVFTARKDYWNKDLQKFQKLTFKILTDLTARTNALVSGQVDATLLDPKTGKQAEGAKMKLAANEVDWQGLLLMDRDGAKNPALQNVKVRQAINYAFDRKTILDQVLLGQGTPTSQPFGKASGAWTEELENYYRYDPAKAKQLLKEAGYETGVTLEVPSVPGFETQIAVVQQQLADVGITLKVGAAHHQHLHLRCRSDRSSPPCTSPSSRASRRLPSTRSSPPRRSTTRSRTPPRSSQAKIDAVQNGGADAGKLAQEVNKYVVEQAWFAPLFRVNQMYYHNAKIDRDAADPAGRSVHLQLLARQGRHNRCRSSGSFANHRLGSGIMRRCCLCSVSALTFSLLYMSSGSIARNILGDQATPRAGGRERSTSWGSTSPS